MSSQWGWRRGLDNLRENMLWQVLISDRLQCMQYDYPKPAQFVFPRTGVLDRTRWLISSQLGESGANTIWWSAS